MTLHWMTIGGEAHPQADRAPGTHSSSLFANPGVVRLIPQPLLV